MQDSILKIAKHWGEICRIVEGSKSYWEGDSADAHNRIYEDVKRDMDEVLFGSSGGDQPLETNLSKAESTLPEVF
jgi:hypothetical protein